MQRAHWGILIACLSLLGAAGPAAAQTRSLSPASGMLLPAATDSTKVMAGTFYWDGTAVSYQSEKDADLTRVDAAVMDTDGKVIAEGTIDPDGATVVVAGVKITSGAEISEDEAKLVAAFAETEQAAAIRAMVTAIAGATPLEKRGDLLGLTAIALVLGDGPGAPQFAVGRDCFGCCGPGCWGCYLLGRCYTTACAIHDGCVALFGHTHPACLKLLLVAIASYLKECLHVL